MDHLYIYIENIPDYGGPIYLQIHNLLIPTLAKSKNTVPQYFQLKSHFTHNLQSECCSSLQGKYKDINLFMIQYTK